MTMSTSDPKPDEVALSPVMRRLFTALSMIERVGNALPHPFWLFWILSAILAVASAVLAGLGRLRGLAERRRDRRRPEPAQR